jgi:hypothetical protein
MKPVGYEKGVPFILRKAVAGQKENQDVIPQGFLSQNRGYGRIDASAQPDNDPGATGLFYPPSNPADDPFTQFHPNRLPIQEVIGFPTIVEGRSGVKKNGKKKGGKWMGRLAGFSSHGAFCQGPVFNAQGSMVIRNPPLFQ